MVHAHRAIQEAWRVLKPDGTLCDIHPIDSNMPVEVVELLAEAGQGTQVTMNQTMVIGVYRKVTQVNADGDQ